MANLSLREKKEEAKKEWEACFSRKMEDSLNEEGIKHYWDDDTSLEDALDLLTSAAINDAFDSIIDNIIGIAVIKHKEKKEELHNNNSFMVMKKSDRHLYSDVFDTEEGAQDFINDIAMTTSFTTKDFEIIKVQK